MLGQLPHKAIEAVVNNMSSSKAMRNVALNGLPPRSRLWHGEEGLWFRWKREAMKWDSLGWRCFVYLLPFSVGVVGQGLAASVHTCWRRGVSRYPLEANIELLCSRRRQNEHAWSTLRDSFLLHFLQKLCHGVVCCIHGGKLPPSMYTETVPRIAHNGFILYSQEIYKSL